MMGDSALPNRRGGSNATLASDMFRCDSRTTFITPFFPSVPTLNGAASYIAQTTNLLTSCFSDDSVDYLSSPAVGSSFDEQELVTFPLLGKEENYKLPASSGDYASISESRNASIAEEPSTSDTLTPNDSSGISLFQRLIEKARKTVRGSADDIGWLQHAPGMPPVVDGTGRFNAILDDIRHGLHKLPNSLVYMLVPGLFSNHGPLYFVNTMRMFSKLGLTCHITKIHSEASVEKNAKVIKDFIEELYTRTKKRVLILGHSKGGIDSAAALSLYWPELRDKVAGLALAQSPYGGSPLASDILREGQLGDYINVRKLMEIIICKVLKAWLLPFSLILRLILTSEVLKGDIQALEDLTYERRKEFLLEHNLPEELPVVSFCTEVAITPAVLATLSRVAHAELPLISPLATGEAAKVPVVIPLSAAMAACAQLLQTRYGEKSDGLVTCRDAEVPGSVVVRPKKKMDHAWMVYSSADDDPMDASASQVCEALLTLLLETSHSKKHHFSSKCD